MLAKSGMADDGPTSTFFNINSWKIQMEHQGFFQWNGTSHGSAGNYPKGMGSVIFVEGILWGVKASDKYGVKEMEKFLPMAADLVYLESVLTVPCTTPV